MAQSGFTPIKLYLSTTAAATPTAGNLEPGELALNNNDGKLFYEDSSGVVQVLATKAGASGDVVGPASATANAIPSFNGTTGKLIQDNSGVTIAANVVTATGFTGALNGTLGATTPATVVATQVDITAQGDLRLQDSTGGEYVALQAPGTIATSYTLTLPVDDGTSGQALITDGSGVLSWSSAASGDVYGPASATDNAIARFDGTTGKIIQSSAVTIADDGATVIAANSTSDGLRITQIGTGNALLVEDSANPDSSPTLIDNAGRVIVGATATRSVGSSFQPSITNQVFVEQVGAAGLAPATFVYDSNDSNGARIVIGKSRGTAVGAVTALQSGDSIGSIIFAGADGTTLDPLAARIEVAVDGTPGTNDMPGRLVFSTTADGASSPTERMRISNAGNLSQGTSGTSANYSFFQSKNVTGATVVIGFGAQGVVQSDVTNTHSAFRSNATTAAASFTLSTLNHFEAGQPTFGAGSAVTNQFGFAAGSTLTGATNNYGFYSNIASGTGRWNFYANGTADNYFAGNVGIGTTTNITPNSATVNGVNIGGSTTATTDQIGVTSGLVATNSLTNSLRGFISNLGTAAAAFTLPSIQHFRALQSGIGAGSTVTNQYGYFADGTLIGATNNYGFYGNIASGTGRFNFYANGTAANVFAGTTSIGGLVGAESLRVTPVASAVNYFEVQGAITSSVPIFRATGSDTNVPLTILTKGTGYFNFQSGGGTQFFVGHTASAVNYIQVTGNGAGTNPNFTAQGSDANVGIFHASKGTGSHAFYSNSFGALQFNVSHTASTVNWINATGSPTANAVTLSAQGSDTNIDLALSSKGTGVLAFGTYTAGIIAQAGYITIKDAGGTTRRLLVG
jgi:hypothetical protein